MNTVKIIENGSITSVDGFKACGVSADIKGVKNNKLDVALIYSEKECTASGVFTTNKVRSKTVDISRDNINNKINAIIINSGNANACVGKKGYEDALRMTQLTGDFLNIPANRVVVNSTGVIGQRLPMDRIENGIRRAVEALTESGGLLAAEAIMTTDTKRKNIAVECILNNGEKVTIGGIAKGSGMIHPNMATMLGYVTMDVNIDKKILDEMLIECVDNTFNSISVDRDTSTNDSLVVLANGLAGNKLIESTGDIDFEIVKRNLHYVLEYLSKSIAVDGEGATKLVEINVKNAETAEDAKKIGMSVVTSPLVKTAIFGEDANWGRIIAAVGYSGADVYEGSIDIFVGNIQVCENGMGILEDETEISEYLKNDEIVITIDIKLGQYDTKVWGCDLSYDYVKINADYRS